MKTYYFPKRKNRIQVIIGVYQLGLVVINNIGGFVFIMKNTEIIKKKNSFQVYNCKQRIDELSFQILVTV